MEPGEPGAARPEPGGLSTLSRIRHRDRGDGRGEWALDFRQELSWPGAVGVMLPVRVTCTLELVVHDPVTAQRLIELAWYNYIRGCPTIELTREGSYRIRGVELTEAEATAIARENAHPVDVLLPEPKPGTVIAVPVDMREFL